MCRLFGMSGGAHEVQATFWLLDAPTSLLQLSETQPDGVGLGTFNSDGTPWVYRKPVAASRSQTFIADAHEVRSRTFLAHIRHATAAPPTLENTHPFLQHDRLFAHNGVLGGLDALRERLGEHASLLQGSTDSELYFTLMTKRIEENGGDIAAGIAQAAQEIAAEIPLYSLNMLLTTPTDVWALRYPDTNELWILERSIAALGSPGGPDGSASFDERSMSGITRVFSGQLAILPSTVIASQPMDTNPLWRMLDSGELIHVDQHLNVTSTIAVPDPPAEMLVLSEQEAIAQHEDPAPSA
ncbi:MAG TPA: class II glutamine amidotransferase [Solirubrobacteraceae bacterium]|nr:class II glutamine amidotransferase [Solirubrobacteraceae bacterium]